MEDDKIALKQTYIHGGYNTKQTDIFEIRQFDGKCRGENYDDKCDFFGEVTICGSKCCLDIADYEYSSIGLISNCRPGDKCPGTGKFKQHNILERVDDKAVGGGK